MAWEIVQNGFDSDLDTLVHEPSSIPSGGVATDEMESSIPGNKFVMFGGELHLDRDDEAFLAVEAKWSGWSSFSHNVEWPASLADLSIYRKLASRQRQKHVSLCEHGSTFPRVSKAASKV